MTGFAIEASPGRHSEDETARADVTCGVGLFPNPPLSVTAEPYHGSLRQALGQFAMALDARGKGRGGRAFSLHPGQIPTDLARHLTAAEISGFEALDDQGRPIVDPSRGLKTVEQGASTGLWCATSPALNRMGGVYCEDCDIAPANTGATGRAGVAAWASAPALAERPWLISERWTDRGRRLRSGDGQ